MVTTAPVKRGPGRPPHKDHVVSARPGTRPRGRPRKEDVDESPSPVSSNPLSKDPRGLNAQQRARYFAIKAAIITPGIERCAEYQGGRVTYIVKDGLLHRTDAMVRVPPYRPRNGSLKWYSLTEAQIEEAFGP